MQGETKEAKASNLPKINFFLLFVIGAGGAIGANWFSEQLNSYKIEKYFLQERVKVLETQNKELSDNVNSIQESIKNIQYEYFLKQLSNIIDFTVSGIQTVGDGFMLTRAEQEAHLTGIKFKGRILNTQSVRHRNITFKLTVNKIEKNFTINQVSAGNSTSFEIYVPDLTAENARYGKIEYVESSVEYYTK